MTTRRFESISGILNRTPAPATAADPDPAADPAQQPEPVLAPQEAGNVTKLHPKPNGRRSAPPANKRDSAAPATHDGGVRRVAFRLDPTLHAGLTTAAASQKTSLGQVVLDAVEAAHHANVLRDLVAAEAASPEPDGLFPRLQTRGTARATVPVEIRLHARAAAVLDTLVDQTQADSRTQLIVAALRHRLK